MRESMRESVIKRAKALRLRMNKVLDERDRPGLCHFGAILPKGYIADYGEPCHANLSSCRYSNALAIVTIVSYEKIKNKRFKKGFTIPYYRWLLNKSPFSTVFITKNPRTAINSGIICRTDVPSNLLAAALIATRYGWERDEEGHRFLLGWGELRRRGVDEGLAFLLSHKFRLDEDSSPPKVSWDGYGNGHCCIQLSSVSIKGLKAFISGDVSGSPELNKLFRVDRYYNGVFRLFDYGDKSSVEDRVKQGVKGFHADIRGKRGLLGNREGKPFEYKEGLDVMARWAKKYYSEVMS